MIAGLSWAAWVLLLGAMGTGLAVQVLFFIMYRRAGGGHTPSRRSARADRGTGT